MSQDAHLLTDLKLALRHSSLRPVYVVQEEDVRYATPRGITSVPELSLSSGRGNLEQAIILRLLTPRGELAQLGHPDYGSRLHELLGRPNTPTKRNLVRLYILEALAQEPRIEKVTQLEVTPAPPATGVEGRMRVYVRLEVEPIAGSALVNLGPFALEL